MEFFFYAEGSRLFSKGYKKFTVASVVNFFEVDQNIFCTMGKVLFCVLSSLKFCDLRKIDFFTSARF